MASLTTVIALHSFRSEVMAVSYSIKEEDEDDGPPFEVTFSGRGTSYIKCTTDVYADPVNTVGVISGTYVTSVDGAGFSGENPADFEPPPSITVEGVEYMKSGLVTAMATFPQLPPTDPIVDPPSGWLRCRLNEDYYPQHPNWAYSTKLTNIWKNKTVIDWKVTYKYG